MQVKLYFLSLNISHPESQTNYHHTLVVDNMKVLDQDLPGFSMTLPLDLSAGTHTISYTVSGSETWLFKVEVNDNLVGIGPVIGGKSLTFDVYSDYNWNKKYSGIVLDYPSPVTAGQQITITATLRDSDTGTPLSGQTVSIYLNENKIGEGPTGPDGKYSVTITAPNAGWYWVIGEYEGNPTYRSSILFQWLAVQAPTRYKTQITLNVPDQVEVGSVFKIQGTLSWIDSSGKANPLPGMAVLLYINDQYMGYTYTDNGGNFSWDWAFEKTGSYKIKVVFGGGPEYEGCSAEKTVNVVQTTPKKTELTITAPESVMKNTDFKVSGFLSWLGDTTIKYPLPNRTIHILVDGSKVGDVKTSDAGYYEITLKISETGSHEIKAVYDGETYYLPATASTTITVTGGYSVDLKITKYPGIAYTCQSFDVSGYLYYVKEGAEWPIPNAKVEILARKYNTTTYDKVGEATTDSNGNWTAKVTIAGPLDQNESVFGATFYVKAHYAGSDIYEAGDSQEVDITMKAAAKVTITTLSCPTSVKRGENFDITVGVFYPDPTSPSGASPVVGATVRITWTGQNIAKVTTGANGYGTMTIFLNYPATGKLCAIYDGKCPDYGSSQDCKDVTVEGGETGPSYPGEPPGGAILSGIAGALQNFWKWLWGSTFGIPNWALTAIGTGVTILLVYSLVKRTSPVVVIERAAERIVSPKEKE
jgi:hypothetical protein